MTTRGITITHITELSTEECCSCRVLFAMPKGLRDECLRRKDKKVFYCPNGHQQYFIGEREEDILRRERDRLRQEQAWFIDELERQKERCKDAARQASAARGQVTKLKKRAANGVCPCCTRHFTNLERHMATKHPDFSNVVEFKAS